MTWNITMRQIILISIVPSMQTFLSATILVETNNKKVCYFFSSLETGYYCTLNNFRVYAWWKCLKKPFKICHIFWNKKTQNSFFFIMSHIAFVTIDALIYVDLGRIQLVHLQIRKYFTDDSSVNFHDKFFLHFLLKLTKK